jgi:hypothetical protein
MLQSVSWLVHFLATDLPYGYDVAEYVLVRSILHCPALPSPIPDPSLSPKTGEGRKNPTQSGLFRLFPLLELAALDPGGIAGVQTPSDGHRIARIIAEKTEKNPRYPRNPLQKILSGQLSVLSPNLRHWEFRRRNQKAAGGNPAAGGEPVKQAIYWLRSGSRSCSQRCHYRHRS